MRSGGGNIGCLLIGDATCGRMKVLQERLSVRGVVTASPRRQEDLLSAAQEGLYTVRRPGGVCVAAEGEYWAMALALAVQLSVERVALIAPTDRKKSKDDREKQIQRLKGFARRNLFFCVSDVLVLEEPAESREIDRLCRQLTNAWIVRSLLGDDCGGQKASIEAAAQFLYAGDFTFPLAE